MSEANLRYKLNKKLKLPIGGSKNSKIGSKRAQSSGDDKREKGWNRNFKSSVKGEQSYEGRGGSEVYGKGKFKPLNYGGKWKRKYTDPDAGWDQTSHYLEKSHRKEAPNQVNNDVIKEKSRNHSPRTMWFSSRMEDAISKTKRSSRKPKDAVENVQVSDGKLKTKLKEFDKREPVKMDGSQNDSLKKHVKSKSDSNKHLDQSRSRTPDVYKFRSVRKTVRGKKGMDGDSEIMDGQPIKKKRVIRIDPHDISNKRLDDGIVISGSTKEKEKDVEKKVEMSKNAQFRAIQPSPSMLSYVEDNLLGRRRLIELRRAGYNIELSAPLDNIPFSTSSERERIEENIFRNKLEFFAAAKISSSFPPPDLPEIAFAGRSNVGKSSLLNSLTRQWGVARTSDKPGLTQTINFFKLGPKHCLVDLPGYGFAYAKEEVKDAWEELAKEYVSTRVGLKRVCLLIDTKWGMKPRDRELIDLMEISETKYQIVLTKTDTVFPFDVARRATQIEESLKANKSVVQPVLMASSKTGAGIRSLRTVLAKIALFAKP